MKCASLELANLPMIDVAQYVSWNITHNEPNDLVLNSTGVRFDDSRNRLAQFGGRKARALNRGQIYYPSCKRHLVKLVPAGSELVLDETLRVTFMPPSEMPQEDDAAPASEEGPEVAEGDLDLFPFDGDKIDLEPLFREQFVLAIPYAPLCREDCKGLCPQCGIDRNTSTCSCEKPIDPRLAVLKGLKLPS
jgi:hypothetical protein